MTSRSLIGLVLLILMTGAAGPAAAQDVAEVRTWTGQSWRLTEPSLEMFYTIVPPAKDEGALAAPAEATAVVGGTGRSRALLFGSMEDIERDIARRPEPLQENWQATAVTLSRDGVETRVPLERIATLTFYRQPLLNSTLPPYVAPTHFRYSAMAVLTDGSRVEADYVNLGTARLRGASPQGRVDLAWEDIEVIRFVR
jgi:hypothetical protein